MPRVAFNSHGLSVEIEDAYGDLHDMAGLALGLSEQLQQAWIDHVHGTDRPVALIDTTDE